jgi:hypothetical protein
MTVLFSVGEGTDNETLIPDLLNVDEDQGKPGYKLASPEPLLFSHCEYWPPVFGKVDPNNYQTSPANIFSKLYESTMVNASQTRVGMNLANVEQSKLSLSDGKSIVRNQKSLTLSEKVDKLKGSKKTRYENVQKWKETIIEKEGQLLGGRSRSRSLEKKSPSKNDDAK